MEQCRIQTEGCGSEPCEGQHNILHLGKVTKSVNRELFCEEYLSTCRSANKIASIGLGCCLVKAILFWWFYDTA